MIVTTTMSPYRSVSGELQCVHVHAFMQCVYWGEGDVRVQCTFMCIHVHVYTQHEATMYIHIYMYMYASAKNVLAAIFKKNYLCKIIFYIHTTSALCCVLCAVCSVLCGVCAV